MARSGPHAPPHHRPFSQGAGARASPDAPWGGRLRRLRRRAAGLPPTTGGSRSRICRGLSADFQRENNLKLQGSGLNPEAPLMPILHGTLGGGSVSIWAAACPPSCTDSDESVSTSTHSCVMQEPEDARGRWHLSVQTHGRMHARARTHSRPKLPPGGRKPLRIGRESRHSHSGGRETLQGCFLLFPPPYRFI